MMELEITLRQSNPFIYKDESEWYGDFIERWVVRAGRNIAEVIRYNHYNPDTWVKIDEDLTNMDFSEVRKYLEDKLC